MKQNGHVERNSDESLEWRGKEDKFWRTPWGKEERVKYLKSPIAEDREGDKLMRNIASWLLKQNVLMGKYLVFKNSECGKAR